MSAPTVPWCEPGFYRSVPFYDSSASSSDDEMALLYSLASRDEWVRHSNRNRKSFDDHNDLMRDLEADDDTFRNSFRLNKGQFNEVLAMIDDDIKKIDTYYRTAISSRERLAICLRFLASGDAYRTISCSYRVGTSTVTKIVEEVCDALWKRMQPVFMPTPDEAMWRQIEYGFKVRWNFPHCIGAVDGKHIAVQAPPHSRSSIYNYKYDSTVLLGLVDSEYKFIAIDSGPYDEENECRIFMDSVLGKNININSIAIPPDEPLIEGGVNLPYVIVGDEGFPLKRFLLRPFPRRQIAPNKRVYNDRLCCCRRAVENAFTLLAHRWRVYSRPMTCKMDTVHKIIKSTTVLHNYLCCKCDVTELGSPEEVAEANRTCWRSVPRIGGQSSDEAKNIRNQFVAYFNSN